MIKKNTKKKNIGYKVLGGIKREIGHKIFERKQDFFLVIVHCRNG